MEQERKLVLLLELGHELEQERKLVLLLELWHELERELSKLELEAMLSKPGAVSDRSALQEESAAWGCLQWDRSLRWRTSLRCN